MYGRHNQGRVEGARMLPPMWLFHTAARGYYTAEEVYTNYIPIQVTWSHTIPALRRTHVVGTGYEFGVMPRPHPLSWEIHPVMFQIWTSYVTHRKSKLIVIDKQASGTVMDHDRFGEADRFAGEPLDASGNVRCFRSICCVLCLPGL